MSLQERLNPRYIAAGIGCIAAVVLLFIALKPGTYRLHEVVNGAEIQFSADRAWVSSGSECVTIMWTVEGIREVFVDEQGVIGTGQIENCQPLTTQNRLRVVFQDGQTKEYKLDIRLTPFLNTQSLFLMSIAAVLLGIAAVLVSPRLSSTFSPVFDRLNVWIDRVIESDMLAWLIVLFGVLLRLNQYLYNRAIWGDEAVLALVVIPRSYLQLFQPLDFDHGAPIGFLLLERLAMDLFGTGEMALRLVPFLASIGAMVMFFIVGRRFLPRPALILALLFFAASGQLIYYASEFKQYALDVLVALLACWLFLHMRGGTYMFRNQVIWGGFGAALLWFSHPSVFVLASVGMSLLYFYRNEALQYWRQLFFISALWGLSFALNYLVSLRHIGASEYLASFWQFGFAPLSIAETPGWLLERFTTELAQSTFLYFPQIAVIAFIIGSSAFYKSDKSVFLLLILPVAFALAAAIMRRYPFAHRLILFLLPFFVLHISMGLYTIIERTTLTRLARLVVYAILLFPVFNVNSQQPSFDPDIRPALIYIGEHMREGDSIYLHGGISAIYLYYASLYQLEFEREIDGRYDFLESDRFDFDQGERVWVFRRGINTDDPDWQLTLDYFDQHGEKIDETITAGGSAHLYVMGE